jgi:hypothetical protein
MSRAKSPNRDSMLEWTTCFTSYSYVNYYTNLIVQNLPRVLAVIQQNGEFDTFMNPESVTTASKNHKCNLPWTSSVKIFTHPQPISDIYSNIIAHFLFHNFYAVSFPKVSTQHFTYVTYTLRLSLPFLFNRPDIGEQLR